MNLRARWLAIAAGVLLVAGGGAAEVSERPALGCDHWMAPLYEGDDPRVRFETVQGRTVVVLVPPGYDETTERYPVVYLMHGGLNDPHAWLTATDVIAFTAAQPAGSRAIVVMPDGTVAPVWANWRNGVLRDEELLLDEIMPFIDANYRTIADGAYRAVAGFSGGAFGAALLAARHPNLFAALGIFSGLIHLDPEHGLTGAGGAGIVYFAGTVFGYCYGDLTKTDPFGVFGNPIVDPVWIRNANPADLAPNFQSTRVSLYSGNGAPCDLQDVKTIVEHTTGGGPSAAPFGLVESGVEIHTREFSEVLSASGVAHTFDAYGCGIHSYRYIERDLHAWWKDVFEAFGNLPPKSFDYRRADASFSVWGWSFVADSKRAPEFLDVTNASCDGVTLSGSGRTSVTTAPCFLPGANVALEGAVESTATADAEGRVRFTVHLGRPHAHQQYTAAARVLEALGGYWKRRSIAFTRLPG